MNTLAGCRIVVTRSRHQAGGFASALEARGARALLFPTIRVLPVDDPQPIDAAVDRLAEYAWIVFTSANAVETFWERMHAHGVMALPAGVRVASIGPGTTLSLARFGARVDVEPRVHAGAEIAGAMRGVAGTRVLVPRARIAREDTRDALCAAGAVVDEVITYHTEVETPDESALAPLRDGVDAVTFASPSAVHGFAAILGGEAREVANAAVLATIGPTTSAAVRSSGWPEPLEAMVATTDGIITALERRFSVGIARTAPR